MLSRLRSYVRGRTESLAAVEDDSYEDSPSSADGLDDHLRATARRWMNDPDDAVDGSPAAAAAAQQSTAAFSSALTSLIDHEDIDKLRDYQIETMSTISTSRKKIEEVNSRAEAHFAAAQDRYSKSARQLIEMKSDLEYVFKKISAMKRELAPLAPAADPSS